MNCYQTLNDKLNIDEPLKAIKVIDFLFFLFYFWINRRHSSWLLAYLPASALKAAAERDVYISPSRVAMFKNITSPIAIQNWSNHVFFPHVIDPSDKIGCHFSPWP